MGWTPLPPRSWSLALALIAVPQIAFAQAAPEAVAVQPAAAPVAAPAPEAQPASAAAPQPPSVVVEAETDSDSDSDPGVEDEAKRLPWRGTTFTFSQSLNVNTLSKDAQLSYNPTYGWIFILEPRWYLSKTTYLNVDQRLSLELTDSDSTLKRQRAMISDTLIGIDTQLFGHEFEGVGKLALKGGVHVVTPTSIASRAATMVVGGRVRGGGDIHFDHVLHGLSVAVQMRYLQRFLRHTTLEAATPFPCLSSGIASQSCGFLDSETNERNNVAAILSGMLEISDKLSVTALAWFTWSHGATLRNDTVSTLTGPVSVPDRSVTHWRNDRYLLIALGYNVTDWLSLGLSLIDYYSERSPDGSLRSLAKPVDLMLALSTSISFDSLYLAATGQPSKRKRD